MPAQDNERIAGIFPGKVIIVAGGKITAEIYPSGNPAAMDLLLLGD
jgi:hypothetical protein